MWHHISVVREGSSGIVKIFIAGQLDNTKSLPTGNLIIDPDGLWLGREQDCVGGSWGSQDFKGIIDEVRIYNYAQSPSQILDDMDACRPGDTLVKKPDLEPYEITWEPPNPTTSDSITITWKVRNGGEADAVDKFYTKLYIDGKEKNTWSTDGLAAGKSAHASMDIGKLFAGDHTIKVETDTTKTIGESDGSNNIYSRTLTVTGTGTGTEPGTETKPGEEYITITNWGSEGTADSEFYYPRGIAVGNSNNVYVVDTHNNRTQKFDSSGKYITKWGKYGTGDRAFNRPYDVAVDSGGNVYVADTFNHRIQKFAPDIPGVFPTLFYPIIYDNNWNADTWGYTDTTTWTIGKDTLYYSNRHGYVLVKQIVIWYEWDSGEESVSYVIEKDGVEFQKGAFIKGRCISSNSPWCYGRDTLRFYTDMFFPAGTYVLKLTKSKMAQNSGSNGDGFVKLLGLLNPKTSDLFYDNWNPNTCSPPTDTSTWTLDKDAFVEEIRTYYLWDPGEESVSYVIKKDGVEFRKGDFIKGPCHPIPRHLPQEWCRGSDTLDIVFPAGTYVLKLSKPKQGQNKWSNDNGYVRLFGSAVKGTGFDDTIALSDGQTLSGDRDKDEEVYYRFYLSAGQRATVTLQPLEGDQDLYIFNPKRHPIEVSGNSGTETEKCTVTADTSGYYYAKVHGFAAGRYTITLSI
ncbi:MAG: hypothetical protein IMF18_12500 [Proteobacteria bacterium]|nr:hypothetical protein [Pseudomonadota bacterium]